MPRAHAAAPGVTRPGSPERRDRPLASSAQGLGVSRPGSPERLAPARQTASAAHEPVPDTPVRINQGAAATVGGTEPEPELESSSSADGHVNAPLASIGVAGVLSGGLGLPREPVAPDVLGVGMGKGAVELLPEDLRESYAQVRRKPGSALVRACRWLVVVAAYLLAGVGMWWAMYELYFGNAQRLRCAGALEDTARHDMETFIGALPAQARTMLLTAVAVTFCRKVTGARDQGGPTPLSWASPGPLAVA
jgi:hypothetical protein